MDLLGLGDWFGGLFSFGLDPSDRLGAEISNLRDAIALLKPLAEGAVFTVRWVVRWFFFFKRAGPLGRVMLTRETLRYAGTSTGQCRAVS